MPQNILKNQIALAASSPSSTSTGLNRNSNSSFSSSSSSYSPKILNEQQNQYHNPSKAFSISSSNNNNNSTTNNTTFSSNSISRLNQGKLIFLNEKFSHKSENNYDELITNTTINKPHANSSSSRSKNKKVKCHTKEAQETCQCCHLSQDIKTSSTPTSTASGNIKLRKAYTHGESTQKKRLSCEELEDLSERFADFIKIDATTMSQQQQQQKLKCKAPPPPPHSPPLPPPPPDLLHNNDMDLNCTGRTGMGKLKKKLI